MPPTPRSFVQVITALFAVLLFLYALATAAGGFYLRGKIREQIVARDVELIDAVTRRAATHLTETGTALDYLDLALDAAELRGVIGVRIYDAEGNAAIRVPDELVADRLAPGDRAVLADGRTRSRWHPDVRLDLLLLDEDFLTSGLFVPLLELRVPIAAADATGHPAAIVQYWIDGTGIAAEFQALDRRILLLASATWLGGAVLVGLLLSTTGRVLRAMGEDLARHGRALEQANAELTLAARSSAIGAISAHLLHGLKNPLAGLRQYLAATVQDEEAVATARRMQDLIEEAMHALREENASQGVSYSLAECLEWVHHRHRPAAAKAGIRLEIRTAGAGELDGRRANLVLLIIGNLISNAIDATPAGGTVSIAATAEPDGGWQFTVSDTGAGIPAALRDRLFTPGVSGKADGAGLGLAISAQLARHIGAELQLATTGPHGTAFKISGSSANPSGIAFR
jgi:signal transduction histidine kinase